MLFMHPKYLISVIFPLILIAAETDDLSHYSTNSLRVIDEKDAKPKKHHPYYYEIKYLLPKQNVIPAKKLLRTKRIEKDLQNNDKYEYSLKSIQETMIIPPSLYETPNGVFHEMDDEIALRVFTAAIQSKKDQLESLFYVFKLYINNVAALSTDFFSKNCNAITYSSAYSRLSFLPFYILDQKEERCFDTLKNLIPALLINVHLPKKNEQKTFQDLVDHITNKINAILPLQNKKKEIAHSMKMQTRQIAKIYVILADLLIKEVPQEERSLDSIYSDHFGKISNCLLSILFLNVRITFFSQYNFKQNQFKTRKWADYTESWLTEFFLEIYSTFMVDKTGKCIDRKKMKTLMNIK